MKRTITFITAILVSLASFAQADTLRLSSSFTTHVIFPTDLAYVDLSDTYLVAAMIVEQSKNVLALKACQPFSGATSVTAIESNRQIHPFIVVYDPAPKDLVVDFSRSTQGASAEPAATTPVSVPVQPKQKPQHSMEEIYDMPQGVFHITRKENEIGVVCENIVSYGDVLYMVLSLENKSSTDYRIEGATFCIEPKKKAERTALQPKPVFARNRYGNLSAAPGQKSREVYSFDKMTLQKGQVLRIYFYESDDQRNIILDIDWKDLNNAQKGK